MSCCSLPNTFYLKGTIASFCVNGEFEASIQLRAMCSILVARYV